MLMRLLRRVQYWLHHRRNAADLEDEMAFHRSMTTGAAFGNATLAHEDARGIWTPGWLETVWQDARYAARSMRRQPAFAAAAVAILALGMGATTCVFGLLDGLVVRSLPVERPDRLVWFKDPAFSYPIFLHARASLPIFDGFFAWNIDRTYVDWTGDRGELASTDILETSEEFFSTLRVRPALGRTPDRNDTAVAVITHDAWAAHCGGDPSAIGRVVRLGREPITIIGVAPAGFFGVAPGIAPELIVPLTDRHSPADLQARTSAWLHFMGRLKDGLSLEQGNAALQAVWPAVMEATTNPEMPADRRARYLARTTALQSGRTGFSRVRNQFGDPLWLLMALVGLLLAVACASVANLLLARGAARRREIAVRLAIGADRARVFRQLLTEALVLTLMGGAIGLALAWWGGRVLLAFLTTAGDRLVLETMPGTRTIMFMFGLAALVSMVSALLPARGATRAGVTDGLKETGQPGATLLRRWSAGKVLVTMQVALALVLLSGAAVFGRSLALVLAQDMGIEAKHLLIVTPNAAAAGYEGRALRDFDMRVLATLRAMPGIEAAALSWMPPISNTMGNWTQSITIDGTQLTGEGRYVYFNGISPEYFDTVGMILRRGRTFAETDTASTPRIVIVNETLARQYLRGRDPIGHRISIGKAGSRKDLDIVGVVQDAKYRTLQEPARSIAYLPIAQAEDVTTGRDLFAEVRATNLTAAAAAARTAVGSLDPRVPVHIETIDDRIRESTLNERLIAALTSVLGIVALVLACTGLYGLLAFAVSRHGREIGLRIALGARPSSVLWMVQRESLVLAAVGIATGLAGALALGRFVRTLLFQVTPADPVALTGASLVMLAVASASAYLPARRAASVDPVVALKRES